MPNCFCAIKSCRRRAWSDDCVSFHKVPVNFSRKRQWDSAVGFRLPKKSYVCSKHFLQSDYSKKTRLRHRLNTGAVPSVSLDKSDDTPKEDYGGAQEIAKERIYDNTQQSAVLAEGTWPHCKVLLIEECLRDGAFMSSSVHQKKRQRRNADPEFRAREAMWRKRKEHAERNVKKVEVNCHEGALLRVRKAVMKHRRCDMDPQLRAREADHKRQRQQNDAELRALGAEAQRRHRQDNPHTAARKAEERRQQRQENPDLRSREAEARRLWRRAEAEQTAWERLGQHVVPLSQPNTVWPEQQVCIRKNRALMNHEGLDETSTDVWCKTNIQKYEDRPDEQVALMYAEHLTSFNNGRGRA
ncbi:hypothetical protein HPB51_000505 [Rhipicephalus microplus]|uniref:THAP-type domain-containing protein n=1 Tax=Rhipicephalus microplus TaxID=6941 RepID=A0A9J6E552_RHIMP|nr:hypothetical protein HPB51_000505 [Rhipicephalus microplus]